MMGLPSCCEVSRAVASGVLDDAPVHRRLAVRLHLLMCRHCRRYARQIRAIGRAARELSAGPQGDDESLQRLRRSLLARIEPGDGE